MKLCDIFHLISQNSYTALTIALRCGKNDVVDILIWNKPNLDIQDKVSFLFLLIWFLTSVCANLVGPRNECITNSCRKELCGRNVLSKRSWVRFPVATKYFNSVLFKKPVKERKYI